VTVARKLFGGLQQARPSQFAVARMQQEHAPDIARHGKPPGTGAGQEGDHIGLDLECVMNEAHAATAEARRPRMGHRQCEIGRHCRICRRAARRQDVTPDDRRSWLIDYQPAEKPFDEPDIALL